MATQAASTSSGPDNFHLNLAEKLQLPASFCGYLEEKVDGKCLDSSVIKEKSNGATTVILTFHVVDDHDKACHAIGRYLGNRSNLHYKTSTTQPKPSVRKRKTQSQRRRDKKRSREFLERKRLNKKSICE